MLLLCRLQVIHSHTMSRPLSHLNRLILATFHYFFFYPFAFLSLRSHGHCYLAR